MQNSEIIIAELADIKIIIDRECWLEGERRGREVSKNDPFIQNKISEIILNGAGLYLREKYSS